MNKILIISGSHRAYTSGDGVRFRSNSAYFIDRLIERLPGEHIDLLDVNTLTIEHCIDCAYCSNSWGACVFDDDMTHVYRQLDESDVLIFVTPVYFNAVPSRLKVLVDRLQMVYKSKTAHGIPFPDDKPRFGFLAAFGGAGRYQDQFSGVESTIKLVFSNFGVRYESHLFYPATDKAHISELPSIDRDIAGFAREVLDCIEDTSR